MRSTGGRVPLTVSEVRIENFRGIREGAINGLKRLNVFVGRNNTGKSSVLEALYLVLTGCESDLHGIDSLLRVITRRGWYGLPTVSTLFHSRTRSLKVSANFESGQKETLELSLAMPHAGEIPALRERGLKVSEVVALEVVASGLFTLRHRFYVDSDGKPHRIVLAESRGDAVRSLLVDWELIGGYGNVERVYSALVRLHGRRAKMRVLETLKRRFEDVEDVELLPIDDRSVLHITKRETSVPFYVLGDGFKYALVRLMLLSSARRAVVLIEEPELHQHRGSLELTTRAIVDSVVEDYNQVILTTHSLELVDLIIDVVRESGVEDLVKFYRFSLREGRLSVVDYDFEEASKLREDVEYDLRG